jgi:hypothetical protein
VSVIAFYEKVIKVKADVAAYLKLIAFHLPNPPVVIMFGSFLPGLLVGLHHQSLPGSREPTLSWNQLPQSPLPF